MVLERSQVMAQWTVKDIPSQAGRLSVVTGANSGIGWYTALELARAGSEVVLAARSEGKGRDAVDRILRELPGAKVRAELLDLADLASVRAFAAKVGAEPKIDLLVNNAGVMAVPTRQATRDGFELQLGTNFLGPFALTALLMPALSRAQRPRVTTVASGAANLGKRRILWEDLQWEKGYGPWNAYCQSKLADLLFAMELARRSAAAGSAVLSNAAHPGYARTNLQRTGPARPNKNWIEKTIELFMSQDAAAGALPTLRAATAPDASSGAYYGPSRLFGLKGDPVIVNLPKPAREEKQAARLWEAAEKLTGVTFAVPAARRAA
jgi:NAD(P)-dependent dehydrogenase (short-subunit alcohol dehydrogenase family)